MYSSCKQQCSDAPKKCREQHSDILKCKLAGAPNAAFAGDHLGACINQNCRGCVIAAVSCASPFLGEFLPEAPEVLITPHFDINEPWITP